MDGASKFSKEVHFGGFKKSSSKTTIIEMLQDKNLPPYISGDLDNECGYINIDHSNFPRSCKFYRPCRPMYISQKRLYKCKCIGCLLSYWNDGNNTYSLGEKCVDWINGFCANKVDDDLSTGFIVTIVSIVGIAAFLIIASICCIASQCDEECTNISHILCEKSKMPVATRTGQNADESHGPPDTANLPQAE